MTEITNERLKPCPFCGTVKHVYVVRIFENEQYCYCGFCHASGPGRSNYEQAIINWNTRNKKID